MQVRKKSRQLTRVTAYQGAGKKNSKTITVYDATPTVVIELIKQAVANNSGRKREPSAA